MDLLIRFCPSGVVNASESMPPLSTLSAGMQHTPPEQDLPTGLAEAEVCIEQRRVADGRPLRRLALYKLSWEPERA